ncbi:peptidoglycan-binding protein [Hoeflea sp. TYP-13]|uniref:peptidoglycan-binding protein n=1 Tax=Hoeflea sp. TYP-13 TaxID=3230023 RepID=UPI0034C5C946
MMIRLWSCAALILLSSTLHHSANAEAIGPALIADQGANGPLRKGEVFEAQLRLNLLGYGVGAPDGISGRKTKTALSDFAESRELDRSAIRVLLNRLRAETAVGLSPGSGQLVVPPCENGAYTSGSLYTHVQGVQHWGDPIDDDVVAANRDNGTWIEVHCKDGRHVERSDHYNAGELANRAFYTYDSCCDAPIQIQFQDLNGNTSQTIRIGRTLDGHLTHFVGFGATGQANRLIPVTPTERGTLWTMLSFDGSVASRQYNDYWLSDYITGMTLYRGADDRHKYVYFYEQGSLPSAFDRYEGGRKLQEAQITRDRFGTVTGERIRLTDNAGGTYYNRFYEQGQLVREEFDDSSANRFEYLRENTSGGMVRSELFVNGRRRGELKVIRDGVEPRETRLYLSDGRLYATYPDRVVYFVGQRGEPRNGGAFTRKIETPLW